MVGPERPLFVLFGSSIVQFGFGHDGWAAILSDIYARKADILLRGYAGWNSRRALQVIHQIFPKEASVQPSLVIVYFGGNDSLGAHPSGLGPHVPLPEYIQNMRSLLTHIKSLSETTRIIVLTCPPINEETTRQFHNPLVYKFERTNGLLQRYAEACVRLCNDMGVKVVDLFSAVQKKENWQSVCFTDGIHFSREGSIIVVEEILKVLRTAEWEPSLHWKSLPTEFSEDSPYDMVAADGKSTFNVSELCINWSRQWN